MTPIASARPVGPAHIPAPPLRALAHIPGSEGWPLVGNSFALLADPKGVAERFAARYGPVYRSFAFGGRTVSLLGPEANEFVLMDPEKVFSSAHGWERVFGRLFPGGLILLDFDEHRLHRKALSVAFKSSALNSYLESLNIGISRAVARWGTGAGGSMRFYPSVKQLTLDLAAVCFLGAEIGDDLETIKRAFVDMIAATIALVRFPIPGGRMHRGVGARRFMVDYFLRQIPARREGQGEDLFTLLCKAKTDDGALLSPRQIADHMNFMMMAAHDTLASSLTAFVYFLAAHPDWQERLREEVRGLALGAGEGLPFARLDDLPLVEMAFNEALRLVPPAPSILRCALRDTEFAGFRIPRGTRVNVNPLYTHHMPQIWPEPETFDPLRFCDEAAKARHRYAFTPFGGGAHMCLGLRFAYLQAKCFAFHLLSNWRASLPPDYAPEWRYWPIPQPRDGLRVRLTPL
jgi:cytochrome P450